MSPVIFSEMTTLSQPPSDSGELGHLPLWTDGRQCVSRWQLTMRERMRVALSGEIWMATRAGIQPPVALLVEKPEMKRMA